MSDINDDGGLGYDPLAWLREDDSDEPSEAISDEVVASADAAVEAESAAVTAVAELEDPVEVESPATESETPNDNVIRFDSGLDIAAAAEIKERFDKVFEAAADIDVDAADLEMIDGAGLQLMLAITRQAESQSLNLNWKNVDENLQHAAKLLGLSESLSLKG